MITDQLPVWIQLVITVGTGIVFWTVFYTKTLSFQKSVEKSVEDLRNEGRENMRVLSNIDKNVALIKQEQDHIKENISLLKDRVRELESRAS